MNNSLVVDASPVIILVKAELDHLLPNLFDELFMPEAVWNEIMAAPPDDVARKQLPTLGWINRFSCETNSDVEKFDLGAGEGQAISLALLIENARILVDDAAGRRCARHFGIPILGTGAVLVLAKKRGLIASVNDSLIQLKSAGLWIDDSISELLLDRAGERGSR